MQLSMFAITIPRDVFRLVLILTTTLSFVLASFQLKRDLIDTSATLEVVLPSATSNFQSAHK